MLTDGNKSNLSLTDCYTTINGLRTAYHIHIHIYTIYDQDQARQAQFKGPDSEEQFKRDSPGPWQPGQFKERAGFLVSRSLTLPAAPP